MNVADQPEVSKFKSLNQFHRCLEDCRVKLKFVAKALLAGSAAVAIAHPDSSTEPGLLAGTESSSGVADSGFVGLSGKLRGPFFSYLTARPFDAKVNGKIGRYLIGFWPGERGRVTSRAYQNPSRFIEVTRENQDTRISEHFTLRDFLT